jgi:hypothetical protein
MEIISKPSKEAVREWLRQRRLHRAPLPGVELLREELGWKLHEQAQRMPVPAAP